MLDVLLKPEHTRKDDADGGCDDYEDYRESGSYLDY
jgi:hypothetical protein